MKRLMPLRLVMLLLLIFTGIVHQLQQQWPFQTVLARPIDDESLPAEPFPTTPEDFVLPGTQPTSLEHSLANPDNCASCHANYELADGQPPQTRTWQAWQGSMMAQAGRDPLFFAALDVANAGAANSGEFCLRCHMPRGWLEGRSSTPDGSEMTAEDQEGVQCAFCHRLVDPAPDPSNPTRDEQILTNLTSPVSAVGSGQMVIDPQDFRRGPFDIVADLGFDPHEISANAPTLISPYHQESTLCGTCHDINNPLFSWDKESKSFKLNTVGQAADIAEGFPIERTFSEWKLSDYNSPDGIFAPQFGGNEPFVSSCQDCHMQKITGVAGAFFGGTSVVRNDMPVHDLTGGNTWVPQIIPMHPEYEAMFAEGSPRKEALQDGVRRARRMLTNAALLEVDFADDKLAVKVTNNSGHKLPTGYVEGRRMWLQIEGYDVAGDLIFSSGGYNQATGVLQGYGSDPSLKVYASKQGLTVDWANELGLPAGASFHFALNNMIVSDNRIPPRGYSYEEFNAHQAAPYTNGLPDHSRYADGQYWDQTIYTLPDGVVRGTVRLLYQTASKEYIEFLRDNNPNESPNRGDILYDLWTKSGRSQPEIMAAAPFGDKLYLPAVQQP